MRFLGLEILSASVYDSNRVTADRNAKLLTTKDSDLAACNERLHELEVKLTNSDAAVKELTQQKNGLVTQIAELKAETENQDKLSQNTFHKDWVNEILIKFVHPDTGFRRSFLDFMAGRGKKDGPKQRKVREDKIWEAFNSFADSVEGRKPAAGGTSDHGSAHSGEDVPQPTDVTPPMSEGDGGDNGLSNKMHPDI